MGLIREANRNWAVLLFVCLACTLRAVDFQVEGVVSVQDIALQTGNPMKPINVQFTVAANGDRWWIATVWDTNTLSVTSFDGTNQYLLTTVREPFRTNSAPHSAAMISERRSMSDELTVVRTLWLTFFHLRHLTVGEAEPFTAPFGRDGSPMLGIFSARVFSHDARPETPARIEFRVSEKLLSQAIQQYSHKDKAKASELRRTHTAGSLEAVFEVFETKPFQDLQIPTVAELQQKDPTRVDRVISTMSIKTTKIGACELRSFWPELETTTWVRDAREGEVFQYLASNRIWLSRSEATNIGKHLVVQKVRNEHAAVVTFIGTYGALMLIVVIAIAPAILLGVRAVKSRNSEK